MMSCQCAVRKQEQRMRPNTEEFTVGPPVHTPESNSKNWMLTGSTHRYTAPQPPPRFYCSNAFRQLASFLQHISLYWKPQGAPTLYHAAFNSFKEPHGVLSHIYFLHSIVHYCFISTHTRPLPVLSSGQRSETQPQQKADKQQLGLGLISR